jgi:hypothetical protein
MLNIEEIYKQLAKEMGMSVNPEYTIFTVERRGDAIAIIPGKPHHHTFETDGTAVRDAVRRFIKRTIEEDPEMIKPIIRQVLSEAF